MAWTYTPASGGVFAQVKDEIRFRIGDTSRTLYSLSDEDVAVIVKDLTDEGSTPAVGDVGEAAARVAEAMAERIERDTVTSKKVGATSISREFAGRAEALRRIANRLRGGGSKADMVGLIQDADAPEAVFTMGMFDA